MSHCEYTSVTAVLPVSTAGDVMDEVRAHRGASALTWRARGTLLNDRWWQHWVPPISPAKTILQLIVADEHVHQVVDSITVTGRLHQQATGAIFSAPCHQVYFGPDYHIWPSTYERTEASTSRALKSEQSLIQCIVSQNLSSKVCKAAINAGAHGPIAHYCEGQGLRDRLGWLRITKEHDQETLFALVDSERADRVFDAMTRAGEFHQPGRGLIYRLDGIMGLHNLSSRASSHRYDADMQQIIRAIDHLSGHTHWRDRSVSVRPGSATRRGGYADAVRRDQVRLSAMVCRAQSQRFTDLMLDSGVPGLTEVETFFVASQEGCKVAGARVNDEYLLYQSVVNAPMANRVRQVVEQTASEHGIRDVCLFSNPVAQVVRYRPGKKEHRVAPLELVRTQPEVLSKSG